jgi:hypothetical protein
LPVRDKHFFFAPLMKKILAILLLITTALYVLPVTSGLIAENEISCKCPDGKTDDGNGEINKVTGKEFITGTLVLFTGLNTATKIAVTKVQSQLPIHYTVETPPPDKA